MRGRAVLAAVVAVLAAVVLQTTLINRFQFVSPDLVLLVSILLALTSLRKEAVLLFAFVGGLTVDLIGPTLLGLRASIATLTAYLALRTVGRVDLGPVAVAIWVGLMTLVGVTLFVLIGTLFGQGSLVTTGLGRRLSLVPLANLVLSFPIAPLLSRMMNTDPRGVM